MTLINGFAAEVRDGWLAGLSGRGLFLGLFDGEDELNDPEYERQPIEFGPPQTTEGDVRFVANVNEATFRKMGSEQSIDGWGVFDERGEHLGGGRLEEARTILAGDRIFFNPDFFTLGLP
jgi:hypothetical protein